MGTRNRIVSAVIFAALWVGFMLWWSSGDKGVAHVVILSGIGVGLGFLWFWLSGRQRA